MTREEADAVVQEYDEARAEWRYQGRLESGGRREVVAWARMNALREKVIDAMTGEESTQPLAGNAP